MTHAFTCIFFKKIYEITYLCIRDRIETTPSRVSSHPEEEFFPVPKLFRIEISRPEMPRDEKLLNTPN